LVTIAIFFTIGLSAKPDSNANWVSHIINATVSPLQKIFSFSGQKVSGSLSFFKDVKAVQKENEELKARIDQLEKENAQLQEYKVKNEELKSALNLKDQFNEYDFVGANIIAKDPGNWFNVFTIDIGKNNGIGNNFPVVTGKGLVGSVYSTGLISSKVVSIIDIDSTVSARISKSREVVRVKGDITLKEQGLCRMDYISPEVDVEVGDTIETSGLGGIFPKGIIIGKVKEIRQTNNELNRYAVIEPAVDFKRLEEVFVLKSKTGNTGVDNTAK
jgi:rod shape-determining protein MreC